MKVFVVLSVALAVVMMVQAQPSKPEWPWEFDTPFGLDTVVPPITNATSHLYYDWNLQAQTIDYPEKCFPFAHWDSGFHPCKLYFNPQGVFLSSPAIGLDCCTFVSGIGAIPPEFLQGFNYSKIETATDWWGNEHTCDYWLGIEDFGYWTDSTTTFDVQFRDGPTGVYWHFGNFNVQNQTASNFQLPEGDCSKKCGFLLAKTAEEATEKHALIDPFVRLSMQYYGVSL